MRKAVGEKKKKKNRCEKIHSPCGEVEPCLSKVPIFS